jgi:hypothetical protein
MAKRFALILAALFIVPALQAAELLEVIIPRFQPQVLSLGNKNTEMRVQVNGDALTANDVSVTLEGVSYRVAYNSVECRGNNGVMPSMQGMPCRAGEDFKAEFSFGSTSYGSVVTRHQGYVAGIISAPNGKVYEILPDAGGEVLRQSVGGKFECETVSETVPSVSAESKMPQTDSVSPARRRAVGPATNVVDLAEFWTPRAEAAAGGSVQMEATVRSAVDILNTDTKNSGIQNLRFNLVYVGKLDFPDTASSGGVYLSDFANNSQVQGIRNSLGADLAGIWNEGGGAIANAPRSKAGFAPSSGFHVVNRDGGLGRHRYSHEVFHNFGGQHDTANVSALSGEPYPFARDMCTVNWYTILSYDTCVPVGKDVPTIPYITNPDLTYDGVRLGDPDRMDNARMVRTSMSWVANYYPLQISKNN